MKFRILAAGMILSLVPAALQAAPRDDILEALAKCANVSDDATRHLCFDRLVPQLKSVTSTAPAVQEEVKPGRPAATEDGKSWFGFDVGDIFSSTPTRQTTVQQFGGENISVLSDTRASQEPSQPADIDGISAEVVQYWVDPHGYFIVSLDNSQVWSQLGGDDSFAHFNTAGRNSVVISRGFFRSYNLRLNGGGQYYKVKRMK
ncbi:MAG: hypothetical protein KGM97_06595 [Alphaproteobacteria bacterium]|nr:hypothetical protein [Alphaproteobacteria bacterium]MDE2630642.1 hypothetical protein [Alphaproteobacteria bacterium]